MPEARLERTRAMYDIYMQSLIEFHKKFGHLIQEKPAFPEAKIVELRLKLVLEEAAELVSACQAGDIVLAADASADLLYVTFGTALSFGIPIRPVFSEVHRSNMTKSSIKDAIGKTVKGPDYDPPKIAKILGL